RSLRFDWPAGGTEEFLGRWAAKPDSRRTEAKGVRADPLNVFGAVGRLDGSRNDRTSRCRCGGVPLVARGNLSRTAEGQVGNSGVRGLTLVSINGFGPTTCYSTGRHSRAGRSLLLGPRPRPLPAQPGRQEYVLLLGVVHDQLVLLGELPERRPHVPQAGR